MEPNDTKDPVAPQREQTDTEQKNAGGNKDRSAQADKQSQGTPDKSHNPSPKAPQK